MSGDEYSMYLDLLFKLLNFMELKMGKIAVVF